MVFPKTIKMHDTNEEIDLPSNLTVLDSKVINSNIMMVIDISKQEYFNSIQNTIFMKISTSNEDKYELSELHFSRNTYLKLVIQPIDDYIYLFAIKEDKKNNLIFVSKTSIFFNKNSIKQPLDFTRIRKFDNMDITPIEI